MSTTASSTAKRKEFLRGKMSYSVLRDRWCDTLLNTHASTKDKSDESGDNFCKELKQAFDQFLNIT